MACGPKLKRTRFAPSPTGLLHLGHAYAALTAAGRASPGEFLLRIEDIDAARCRPEFEAAIYEDLAWLGLDWPRPVLRQSERREAYDAALNRLISLGLCYPCRCTRGDIRAALSAPQEGAPMAGPDGLIYPGTCRGRSMEDAGPEEAIRLDMAKALALLEGVPLAFTETGPVHPGDHKLDEERLLTHVGHVILSRASIGTSYHLAVVVDDAAQGITEVTRGEDLFEATQIHVVLQKLLELHTPSYHHHTLIRDNTGKRLAKRDDARAIRRYRDEGETPADVRIRIGL
ncbi:tRNA glutamyl-Q(34) synthetase GluQRS [Frigidibacter sp.]|uniref:tRNA glutamyl-Q(34) synthetase GluQRS n=1 Tax=Frigidibacter sp. TaxID=2586418 RepID=UPI002734D48F|nr:tRNA glutamyl-Q(34) synthetase GluQRS [Frigidibacter sp.]MDP3339885.1 tRNA glutamyl-Q(34) synthetase GluQRS [Frigidibacter sp.]